MKFYPVYPSARSPASQRGSRSARQRTKRRRLCPTPGPKRLRAGHPRLLLDAARVAELRERLDTTHRFLWERYLQDLPRMVAVSKREAPLEDARYDGDLVPELAFAWLMTGRQDLLDVAKAQLLRLATDEEWSTNEDLAYLVPGHYILGMALGYDWLHEALTPAERATVAGRLGREAEAQLGRITARAGRGGATSTSRTTPTRTPPPSPSPPPRCGARTRGRRSGSERRRGSSSRPSPSCPRTARRSRATPTPATAASTCCSTPSRPGPPGRGLHRSSLGAPLPGVPPPGPPPPPHRRGVGDDLRRRARAGAGPRPRSTSSPSPGSTATARPSGWRGRRWDFGRRASAAAAG